MSADNADELPPPPPDDIGSLPIDSMLVSASRPISMDMSDFVPPPPSTPLVQPAKSFFNGADDEAENAEPESAMPIEDKEAIFVATSLADEAGVLKKGLLSKQGGMTFMPSWQKRFVVVSLEKITYAEAENKPLKGEISLAEVRHVTYCNDAAIMKKKRYGIAIVTDPRTYFWACDNEAELFSWMDVLRKAVRCHRARAREARRLSSLGGAGGGAGAVAGAAADGEASNDTSASLESDSVEESILKQGFVLKRAPNKIQFKRRWLSLSTTKLSYADNEGGKAKGMIWARDIQGVLKTIGQREVKETPNCFSLCTQRRTYFFSAESEIELHKWMEAIRGAADAFKSKRDEETARRQASGQVVGLGSAGTGPAEESSDESEDDGVLLKYSELAKRGAVRTSWQRRHFTLSRHRLNYAPGPDKPVKGYICVRHIKAIVDEVPIKIRKELVKINAEPLAGFQVVAKQRTYFMCAATPELAREWVGVLTRLVKDRKKGRDSSLDELRALAKYIEPVAAATSSGAAGDPPAPEDTASAAASAPSATEPAASSEAAASAAADPAAAAAAATTTEANAAAATPAHSASDTSLAASSAPTEPHVAATPSSSAMA